MKSRNGGSALPTGAMSKERADDRSETEYLVDQVLAAKHEMRRALGDVSGALRGCADARSWTRRFPWKMTATALVGGFAASTTVISLVRRKDRQRFAAPAHSDHHVFPKGRSSSTKALSIRVLGWVLKNVVAAAVAGGAGMKIAEAEALPTDSLSEISI